MPTRLLMTALMLLTLAGATARPTAVDPQPVAEKDFAGYLFAYFTGNRISQEAICFAVSTDGRTFRALNGNHPVLDSKKISSTGGVRDPHILRGEDGHTFYMVATDMVSANGWDSNRAMVLMRSDDLVNWSSSVVNMQKRFEGQENLKRVWAPQTIYDAEAGKYMIYWSMKYGDGPDVIYYAYANDTFTDIEGEPRPLFVPADRLPCIDGDIVHADGVYHLFYKTEGHGNGIKVATTRSLTSGRWDEQPDYKQQTAEAVEGAGTFKLIGQDRYILMYDVYIKGGYQFTETDDLRTFRVIDDAVDMDFHPRHGTVIPVTAAELRRLTEKWGLPEDITIPTNPVLDGFHADPVSGKRYLYWGNGYMAGAELRKDMMSIKPNTVTVMTPEGGTLGDYAYREAPYVFHRNGLYYFLWSVDDTGSANYHIAYGTSHSPLGPIEVAKEPVILIQDPAKRIFGTGHCSVIRLPDSDEWRIVYHRINPAYIDNGPGIHREVCIDRMEFADDGTMKRVIPCN